MNQAVAILIFKICWALLLFLAIAAQFLFGGKLIKKGAVFTNLIVAVPYLIVFGWFSGRNYLGTYQGNAFSRYTGLLYMSCGIIGYIISILYLRRNWAISAAIKEGHTVVKKGPYKHLRHPMYFFMILEILGSGLLISNFMILFYLPVVIFIYYFRAREEEKMLDKELSEYRDYKKKTKMLVPGIF